MTRAPTADSAPAPCDSPFLPADLVARLAAGMTRERAQLAVVHTFAQPHPVFALVERSVLPHLSSFLREGGRKIDAWYATLRVIAVPSDDQESPFPNINTPDKLPPAALP